MYCTSHDDLSSITTAATLSYDTVIAQMREILLARLSETAAALGIERDPAKQDQLVSLAMKCFELLQKLPQK